uniref:PSI domain-containing protein n=1 Tax=Manihot esculenta TaxID=3983 RepID=A0A251IYI8_MANES
MVPIHSTIYFPFLLIFVAVILQSSSSYTISSRYPLPVPSHRTLLASQRDRRQQIPICSEMVSRSLCSPNPNCRWCVSEALDDMCFSKAEAWRLPQQVFVCN